MQSVILQRLKDIEAEEGVKILYACESGSRAWGFPSADSDYDVRFIYLRPMDWYLSIESKRDVIERPIVDEIDINGWDLRKALGLFRKSNPPLMEWLASPIVYQEYSTVANRMRQLAAEYYSPPACSYHYLSMAQGNFRTYLKGERVWVKKYFYVLRPVLAVKWIEKKLGIVPMEFATLVKGVVDDPVLLFEINSLMEKKRGGAELDEGPRIPPISDFIEGELTRFEGMAFDYGNNAAPIEKLNAFFRNALEEIWGKDSGPFLKFP